ncbi:MAG: hypothetical protein ACT4QG_10220 [Sporichthyaceae bacterium]
MTVPEELVAVAKAAVARGRAASVSGYVADAMREKAQREDLDVLLDEMLAATGGPLTDEERRAIDEEAGWV